MTIKHVNGSVIIKILAVSVITSPVSIMLAAVSTTVIWDDSL